MRALLVVCRQFSSVSPDAARLACVCLGKIGAVDPGRVDFVMPPVDHEFLDDPSSDNSETMARFACRLITNYLVKALRGATNTKSQNRAAYAIQELLRFCEFPADLPLHAMPGKLGTLGYSAAGGSSSFSSANGTSTTNVRDLWTTFPKHVLETIHPLLQARYTMPAVSAKKVLLPIYAHKSTYKEWLASWTADLLARLVARRSPMHVVASACRGVVRSDISTAAYLLRFFVLELVTRGSPTDREDVKLEFTAVLTRSESATHPSEKSQEMIQLSTQTIFSLIDYLTQWLRRRRNPDGQSATAPLDSADSIRAVEQLLNHIPQSVMAEASFLCQAHARALMHFELHLRSERLVRPEATQLQSLFERLQLLYSKLDEPDAMEGVAMTFPNLSLEGQILEHERAGRWSDAQTCHELALQRAPTELSHHLGLLRCLGNLGHHATVLQHVRGVAAEWPAWRIDLNGQFGIEAAWRLSQWDSVDRLLVECREAPAWPTAASFEARVGELLCSVVRNERPIFWKLLEDLRDERRGPLAAASMESYQRGHDYVVHLHVLQEIETVVAAVWAGQPLSSATSQWDARLRLTQPSFKVRSPILQVRKTLLDVLMNTCRPGEFQGDEQDEIRRLKGKILVHACKTARKAGYYPIAYNSILHAAQFDEPTAHLERARLLWESGQQPKALLELSNAAGLLCYRDGREDSGSQPGSSASDYTPSDLIYGKVWSSGI